MGYTKLKEEDTLKLIFEHEPPSFIIQIILLVFALLSFALPMVMLYFLGFSASWFAISLLMFFCGGFFIRVYLWNFFGKEIIILNPENVIQLFDYKYFKEEINLLDNNNVQLKIYKTEEDEDVIKESEIIDDLNFPQKNKVSKFSFEKNMELIFSIKYEIPYQFIEELKEDITKRLN